MLAHLANAPPTPPTGTRQIEGSAKQYAGPATPDDQPAWLENLKADREKVLAGIHYSGGVFDTPALKWTQTSWIQPQMHPYDRLFYEPTKSNYTVSRYLQDLNDRYGGIDSLLMWPTCTLLNSNLAPCPSRLARIRAHARLDSLALTGPRPTDTNIGIDDRNQFELVEAMPSGIPGLKSFIDELHAAGVHVLWPYNPWDQARAHRPPAHIQTTPPHPGTIYVSRGHTAAPST